MNVDFVSWIDIEDVRHPTTSAKFQRPLKDSKKLTLEDELLADFRELPARKKLNLDNFAFVNVAPSVVPTYLPSVRVFTYNATELDGVDDGTEDTSKRKKKKKGNKRKHGHG